MLLNRTIHKVDVRYKIMFFLRNFKIFNFTNKFNLSKKIFTFKRKEKEKDFEIKRLEKLLEKSKFEKEILLKEVHHRVKNNLQLILSLCNIESRRNRLVCFNNFLLKSQLRVEAIALIHQSLYQSESTENINIQKYIEQLIQNIIEVHDCNQKKINCKIDTNTIFLNIHTTTALGLIITELITNTLKHAFPDENYNAIITIGLISNSDGNFVLSITDNGIGYDFNEKSEEKFGLKLVKILVQQMKGKFKIENNNGVHCTILFKENCKL